MSLVVDDLEVSPPHTMAVLPVRCLISEDLPERVKPKQRIVGSTVLTYISFIVYKPTC